MAISFRAYLSKPTNRVDVLSSQRRPLGSLYKDPDTFWSADPGLRSSIINFNGAMDNIGDTQEDRRLQGALYPAWCPRWHTLEGAMRELSYVLH